jgi:hypothetical protein
LKDTPAARPMSITRTWQRDPAGQVGSIELLGIAELAAGLSNLGHDGDFLLEAISEAILLDF